MSILCGALEDIEMEVDYSADVFDESVINYSIEELEHLFNWYGTQKVMGSTEGLGKIASNISIAFIDFLIKIKKNIQYSISPYYSDLNRSELMFHMDAHNRAMIRVFGMPYTELIKVPCPQFPFTISVNSINTYCKNTFDTVEMIKRIVSLIEGYAELAAAIQINDAERASTTLIKLNTLNINDIQRSIKHNLIKFVAKPSQNKSTFGAHFDSVAAFQESIDLALLYAGEFDAAIKVSKLLSKLYSTFDKLRDAIVKASSTDFDLSSLAGVVTSINHTGELLESYGMLVKEAHHVEHWLTIIADECVTFVKK